MGRLFSWDKKKARSNIKKHGVSFEESTQVFKDPNRSTEQDMRDYNGEDRFNTVGKVKKGLLSVIHTPRDETTRIISARKASKKEKRRYK